MPPYSPLSTGNHLLSRAQSVLMHIRLRLGMPDYHLAIWSQAEVMLG